MGLKSVLVITPTTGSPELIDAIVSVSNQSYLNVDHLIVVDGFDYTNTVDQIFSDYDLNGTKGIIRVDLPFNTGGNGFYGHRVMAAFGYLIDHDYVIFLDQDNWFDITHVETMVKEIEQFNLDWTYSLRKIYSKEREYICDDNCESLGRWPVWTNENTHLVDSSSYCFKTEFFRSVCYLWDHGWGADRRFYTILKDNFKHQNYTCTGKHTLCYRLGGNADSVQKEFFIEGNKETYIKYISESGKDKYPWC